MALGCCSSKPFDSFVRPAVCSMLSLTLCHFCKYCADVIFVRGVTERNCCDTHFPLFLSITVVQEKTGLRSFLLKSEQIFLKNYRTENKWPQACSFTYVDKKVGEKKKAVTFSCLWADWSGDPVGSGDKHQLQNDDASSCVTDPKCRDVSQRTMVLLLGVWLCLCPALVKQT